MNIIVSCHLDTVFKDPHAHFKDGILKGSCDNIAGVLAMALLMHNAPNIPVELTEDEEMYMDGCRQLAKVASQTDDLFIVIDVCDRPRRWVKTINFTVENIHRIQWKHIRAALKPLAKQYRLRPQGEESEAWVYRDLGFPVLEVCVPVNNGIHNLEGWTRGEDMWAVSEAVKLLAEYLAPKNIREIEGEID
jgi:hypothetical protein